jgi:hypothetical protein
MTVALLSPSNPYTLACRIGAVAFAVALLWASSFLLPPSAVVGCLGAATYLWLLFRHPVKALGLLLAFMPFDYLAIALGKFYGLPQMTLVSACTKEVPLLCLLAILARRNGFRPALPDWCLLAFFLMAAMRTLFDGSFTGLAADFSFLIAYAVGAVTVLRPEQEKRWARAAVWIAAVLSVAGMVEVFVLGEGPRTLLYVATDSETDGGQLTASFHAIGFTGLREAATMVGPNYFGALCMVALILWWVYCRNPLPAAMIMSGLIFSVTRSAWLGAAAALLLLAWRTGQAKRLVLFSALALSLFALSVPLLGLEDYVRFNRTSQDDSADSHQAVMGEAVRYALAHPLGSGNGKLSPLALKADRNALAFETTYPNFAAEYGMAAPVCFVGALLAAAKRFWRMPGNLGYAALGILVGIAIIMIFTLPLIDRRLAFWIWFPLGLAVRQSATTRNTASEDTSVAAMEVWS